MTTPPFIARVPPVSVPFSSSRPLFRLSAVRTVTPPVETPSVAPAAFRFTVSTVVPAAVPTVTV